MLPRTPIIIYELPSIRCIITLLPALLLLSDNHLSSLCTSATSSPLLAVEGPPTLSPKSTYPALTIDLNFCFCFCWLSGGKPKKNYACSSLCFYIFAFPHLWVSIHLLCWVLPPPQSSLTIPYSQNRWDLLVCSLRICWWFRLLAWVTFFQIFPPQINSDGEELSSWIAVPGFHLLTSHFEEWVHRF